MIISSAGILRPITQSLPQLSTEWGIFNEVWTNEYRLYKTFCLIVDKFSQKLVSFKRSYGTQLISITQFLVYVNFTATFHSTEHY